MTSLEKIGLLGGTFDPVHYGHLRAALEIKTILALDSVLFIPCKHPVHKNHELTTPAMARYTMLQYAIAKEKNFFVSDVEISKNTPSYTIDTLSLLREKHPKASFCLLLGTDAFLTLPTWHRWKELLNHTHLIVMTRPGSSLTFTEPLHTFFKEHLLDDREGLDQNTSGFIYVQEITSLDISATAIRHQLKAGLSPRFLLPDEVLAYIDEHRLYKF